MSELEVALNPEIGATKAKTVLGEMTLEEWLANRTVDGYLAIHKGKVVFEQYPRMRRFDKHHWW